MNYRKLQEIGAEHFPGSAINPRFKSFFRAVLKEITQERKAARVTAAGEEKPTISPALITADAIKSFESGYLLTKGRK